MFLVFDNQIIQSNQVDVNMVIHNHTTQFESDTAGWPTINESVSFHCGFILLLFTEFCLISDEPILNLIQVVFCLFFTNQLALINTRSKI